MRYLAAPIFVCLIASASFGDEAGRAEQIDAAAAQAYDGLRHQVLAIQLSGDVNVERFIERFDARERFDALLHTARQLGGTRWVDEHTVQVRLEISGDDIAKFFEGLAEKNPRNLPFSLKTLQERYRQDFLHRSFAATGTSTAGCVACQLRPDPSQLAWRAVSDKDRAAAISAARQNAIDRVIDSLHAVDWREPLFSDAAATPRIHEYLHDWLLARPITSIEFRDDLTVQISLAASPGDVWPVLRTAFEKRGILLKNLEPGERDRLRHAVESGLAPASGSALAQALEPVQPAAVVLIPPQPPAWIQFPPLEAEGVSPSVGRSKLRTARAAEEIALGELRARLAALPLNPKMTLGAAARIDPRLDAALRRSLSHAQIARVEYDVPTPGSARVMMTVDLQMVWREVAGQ